MKIKMEKMGIELFIEFLVYLLISNSKKNFTNIKYFYYPLKEFSFLKNNKYKIIRFLSYISPWIIFPYTLFTFLVWTIVAIFLILLMIIWFICNYVNNIIDDFKIFWNKL